MKKNFALILSAVALFLGLSQQAKAQAYRDIEYMVEAGVTGSRISNIGYDSKTLYSFRVGANVDIPLFYSIFSFNPGLYLTQKGEKQSVFENNDAREQGKAVNLTVNPYYLVLPLDFGCRIKLADNQHIQVNAGPYCSLGLGGSLKPTESLFGDYNKLNAFSGDRAALNRLEVGVSGSVRYSYDRFSLRVGGELGLTKATKNVGSYWSAGDATTRQLQLYVMLGFRI